MAWTSPNTWRVGDLVDDTLLNTHIRDNLLIAAVHAHDGTAGEGNDELSGVDSMIFDDITTPSAPGASKAIFYEVAGVLKARFGAAGAEVTFSDEAHTH